MQKASSTLARFTPAKPNDHDAPKAIEVAALCQFVDSIQRDLKIIAGLHDAALKLHAATRPGADWQAHDALGAVLEAVDDRFKALREKHLEAKTGQGITTAQASCQITHS